MVQLLIANKVFWPDSQSLNIFFIISWCYSSNKSWSFIQPDNYKMQSGLSIPSRIWKNGFSIAQKNKLSDIIIYRSWVCRLPVIRVGRSRVWIWDYFCDLVCCTDVRTIIIYYYQDESDKLIRSMAISSEPKYFIVVLSIQQVLFI